MCGIFGYISNDTKKVDVNAFKILGILNEKRGEQSCGITVDADVFHGYSFGDKLFRDFLKGIDITPASKPVLFGHTRKSSSGTVGEYNTHPFAFGTNKTDKGYAFIGAHNGTLYNDKELAEEFKVDLQSTHKNGEVSIVRSKIDSEILLESIFKSKSFKPLSFYNGGAALVWYTPDNNTIYLFSGESKTYEYSHITAIERPLHVWIVDNNTFAFSSEGEPLEVIGANKKDIFQIETNTVYAIKDGDFENAVKTKVVRSLRTNKREVATATHRLPDSSQNSRSLLAGAARTQTTGTTTTSENSSETRIQGSLFDNYGLPVPQKPLELASLNGRPGRVVSVTSNNIRPFVDPSEYKGGRVHVKNFRYIRNGHPANTGVYIYIPAYGLKYISDTLAGAVNMLKTSRYSYHNVVADVFVTEENFKVTVANDPSQEERYYKLSGNTRFYFMYKGFLLDTILDYQCVTANPLIVESNTGVINTEKLSHMTTYPVLSATPSHHFNKFIKNGEPVEEDYIGGACFDAVYHIVKGYVIKQTEVLATSLAGVDIANKATYTREYANYLIERKVEEDKAKNNSTDMTYIDCRKMLIKCYSEENANILLVADNGSLDDMEVIVDDVVDHYFDYEEDCIAAKDDVGTATFLDNVKLVCRQHGCTLDQIVFELIERINVRAANATSDGKFNSAYYAYKSIPKILLNYEQNYN